MPRWAARNEVTHNEASLDRNAGLWVKQHATKSIVMTTQSSSQSHSARRNFDEEANEFVLQAAHKRDVKFVRLWFTDILGTLKGFAITVDELDHVLNSGASFDGAAINGLAREGEADTIAMPDPSSWQVLPWRPQENAVASMFCDLYTPDGEPLPTDARHILRTVMRRAQELGFTFYVAPELEFFYVSSIDEFYVGKGQSQPTSIDLGNGHLGPAMRPSRYFDQTSTDIDGAELRREAVLALESMGIPVKHSHHEVALGQHEIDLRHTNALTMADSVVTYRVVVKELAAIRGGFATFMPQPFGDRNGSGMHTHMSLFRGDENVFFAEDQQYNLSEIGQRFVAGLLRHAAEVTAITNQWVNSYKRLVPGFEAPVFASWTSGNMNDLIRIPTYRPGQERSVRVEYRAPDSACNPYLAFAALLAAGLEGIVNEYPLPQPVELGTDRDAAGLTRLPRNLQQAVALAENSPLLKQAIGPEAMDSFCRNKTLEWEAFSRAVTDYEMRRYLDVV